MEFTVAIVTLDFVRDVAEREAAKNCDGRVPTVIRIGNRRSTDDLAREFVVLRRRARSDQPGITGLSTLGLRFRAESDQLIQIITLYIEPNTRNGTHPKRQ